MPQSPRPSSRSCPVCENSERNQEHEVREMMFGLRHRFHYLECGACGTLSLIDPPQDLSPYYPDNYYSYEKRKPAKAQGAFARWRAVSRTRHWLGRSDAAGRLLTVLRRAPACFEWLAALPSVELGMSILDVGCGSGGLLLELQRYGFQNLTGIDPFLDGDISHPGGVQILRRDLDGLDGSYDLVMLHHSLEHMPDPENALRHVARLLRPGRAAVIRIPVPGASGWRTYGVDWVQIDAPRHFFLLTPAAIELLSKKAGLRMGRVIYDSYGFQFWGSELYRRDIPLRASSTPPFSRREMKDFERRARELNLRGDGDQAVFILHKDG